MEGNKEREGKKKMNKFNPDDIVVLTGNALQDDETFKTESDFIPERDQVYIEMKQQDNTFLVGAKDILLSLKLLEQLNEVPPINGKWWSQVTSLYGKDFDMIRFAENERD